MQVITLNAKDIQDGPHWVNFIAKIVVLLPKSVWVGHLEDGSTPFPCFDVCVTHYDIVGGNG
jgi:hypothetical protein